MTAPPNARTHDVIIVGARPAGAATAMLLAHAGLDVLVIDRATHGDAARCLGRLSAGAVIQLDRWGLLPRLAAARTPPLHRTVIEIDGQREQRWLGQPLMAPRRTVLDPILVGAARYAGATVRYGVTVDTLDAGPEGRVRGVLGRTAEGHPFRATARLIIGADGPRSRIARLVGAPSLYRGRSASAIAYRHVAGWQAEDDERIFRRGSTAGRFATDRDLASVWIGLPAARLPTGSQAGDDAWFHRTLERTAPELAEAIVPLPAGPVTVFPGASSRLRLPWGPGWALVGDAGAFIDPVGGHGLAAALRDAELLAGAVVATTRDGHDERTAMLRYRRERDRLTRPILTATDAIAGYDWDGDRLRRHLEALRTAIGTEARFLRGHVPKADDQAVTHRSRPAEPDVLTTAMTTTELASIVIEMENVARYTAIDGATSERGTGATPSYRQRQSAPRETVTQARDLLHHLIDREYELLCAIESESS